MSKFHKALNIFVVFLYFPLVFTWAYSVFMWGIVYPVLQWMFPEMDTKTWIMISIYPIMVSISFYVYRKDIFTRPLRPIN